MMSVFLYLLNVILITRAPWVFYDDQIPPPILIAGFAIQLSGLLLLRWGLVVLFLITAIVLFSVLTWFLERRELDQGVRLGARLIGLACWVMVLGFLCSNLLGVSFNGWVIKMVHGTLALSDALSFIRPSHLLAVSACCAGVISLSLRLTLPCVSSFNSST